MPTDKTEVQQSAQAAIDEASRTVAEASRRTSQQAQQMTQTLLDQSTEINRTLFDYWLTNTEALWRVAFEIQHAELRAGLAWWQTVADASAATLSFVERWEGVSRQTQQLGLDTLEASARALTSTVERGTHIAKR